MGCSHKPLKASWGLEPNIISNFNPSLLTTHALRRTGATSEVYLFFLSDQFEYILALNAFLYISFRNVYSTHINGDSNGSSNQNPLIQ